MIVYADKPEKALIVWLFVFLNRPIFTEETNNDDRNTV